MTAPQSALREALTRLWSVVSDHLEYPHEPLVIENNLATAINSVLSAPPLAIQIPLGVGAHEAQVIIEQTRAALSAPGETSAAKALPTQGEIEAMARLIRERGPKEWNFGPSSTFEDAASMLEALGKAVAEKGERESGWFLEGE